HLHKIPWAEAECVAVRGAPPRPPDEIDGGGALGDPHPQTQISRGSRSAAYAKSAIAGAAPACPVGNLHPRRLACRCSVSAVAELHGRRSVGSGFQNVMTVIRPGP